MKYALVGAVLGGLAGCASLPQFDPDLACNIPTRSEAQTMALIESESTALTGTNFVPGNAVHLLENGPKTYAAMQAALHSATQRIDMESYEFDGNIAEQFADLLIAAHARGVQVDLIYDDYGSNAPAALFKAGAGHQRSRSQRLHYNGRGRQSLVCTSVQLALTDGIKPKLLTQAGAVV